MIDRFLTYLRCELNYSAHTVHAYKSDLHSLSLFLTGGKAEVFDPATVTMSDLRAWIARQGEEGLAARTLRRKILAARAFFKYLRRCGDIARNPAADLQLPSLPAPLPVFVREGEMERVLAPEEFDTDDFSRLRDLLVVDMLYSTGIRRSELLAMRDLHIDLHRQEIKILGKGSKQRFVPLAPQLCQRLSHYMSLRDNLFPAPADMAFWRSDSGRPLNNYSLSRIVKVQLASTSASRKTPHVLRHSCATAMLRHDARLDAVKQLLGHASLSTTQIYTHLSFSELKTNYQLAHPRAQKK